MEKEFFFFLFFLRIPFISIKNKNHIFPFKRTQFSIPLSFATTINKVQGHTLDYVKIYLPEPIFSHGQLCVALSRVKTSSLIKILIRPTLASKLDYNCTKNIVYLELLMFINSYYIYMYHSGGLLSMISSTKIFYLLQIIVS